MDANAKLSHSFSLVQDNSDCLSTDYEMLCSFDGTTVVF